MATRFGVFVPQGWRMDLVEIDDPIDQYEAMTNVAKEADAGRMGLDLGLRPLPHHARTHDETTFECWTISATLARDTTNVHIGQMVGCNGYRSPSLYAKIASTVDVASHGRLYAGIGAGWYEHEWRAYGYEWTDTPERMGRSGRGSRSSTRCGPRTRRPSAASATRSTARSTSQRAPIPGRKVPLWIGGGGEQVTLKLVAQYGDACNLGGDDLGVLQHKLDVLKGHCDAVGRNFDDIIRSTGLSAHPIGPTDDPEQATAEARGDTSFEEYTKGTIVGTAEGSGSGRNPSSTWGSITFSSRSRGWPIRRRR